MHRPNALPAREFGKNNAAQAAIDNEKKRLDGTTRRCVQDLCGFCLRPVYVRRHLLPLLRKGYKFGCWTCHDKGMFKWKSEGGTESVVPTMRDNEKRGT